MKLLILGGMLACQCTTFLPPAFGQNNKLNMMATGPLGRITLQADSIQRRPSYPSVIQLKGNVEIKTKTVVQDSPLSLMIMVVRADKTRQEDVQSVIEILGRGRMLGVVLNGTSVDQSRYGYQS